MNWAIEARRQLHLIPEAGYEEFKTQATLEQLIRSLDSSRVQPRRPTCSPARRRCGPSSRRRRHRLAPAFCG